MSKNVRNRALPQEVVTVTTKKNKGGGKKKVVKAIVEPHKMSAAERKRWYLGVGKTSFGPFSTDGFGIGSGTAPANLGRARGARNILEGLPQAPEGAVRVNTGKSQNVSNTFCRREMIGPINGNVSFGVTEWRINPGNVALFPWLSQLAPLYEKYKVHSLSFVFVQTGSGFAAANVSGRCVMGCDYDVLTPAVSTDQEAEMKDPSVPFAPYETAILRVNPGMLNKTPLFLRGEVYPPGSDPKTYDGGKLFFCSVGTPSADQIGTLYIDYEIEMFTPQLPDVIEQVTPNYSMAGYRITTGVAMVAVGVDYPLNMTREPGVIGGALGVTHIDGTNAWTFSAGTYRFEGFVAVATPVGGTITRFEIGIANAYSYAIHTRAGGTVPASTRIIMPFVFVLALNSGQTVEMECNFQGALPGPTTDIDTRLWITTV